jgi:hypothetical protein
MRLRRRAAIAASILLTMPASASTHVVDIAWDPQGRFVHVASIDPGKFVELCGKLSRTSTVRWAFDASAPTDFNIHYHQGKDVVLPAKMTAVSSGADVLRVDADEDYCWMWSNKSAVPIRLSVRLAR